MALALSGWALVALLLIAKFPLLTGVRAGFLLCVCSFAEGGSRDSPRRAPHFLLLRQKKVSKEKATLLCVTPLLRSGATCDAHAVRGPRKLAFGSNSARP